jgi:plastocyanin
MMRLSAIFFSFSAASAVLLAADVTGRVQLLDSHEASVRKHFDYSGVVVSLYPVGGAVKVPPIHAVMKQRNKTFSPHVLAIPVGSSVDFPNLDPIFHNAFSNYNGQIFDLGLYAPGSSRAVKFSSEGAVRVFCNIHSSMSAMIVVVATPYYAVTKRDGSFTMANVPPGDYDLRLMHERATDATLRALFRRVKVPQEPLALPVLSVSEAGYLEIPHKNKYGHDYPPETDDHLGYSEIGK